VIANSPVKGKYDQAIDSESAYEVLAKRVKDGTATVAPPGPGSAAPTDGAGGGGILGGIASVLGGLFGTDRKRGQRLSAGQAVAREVTRTVINRVAGQIAADFGKSLGGKTGGSVGRAIVRGTLGGILRR
jgi:hypothetical protein